MFLLVLCRPVFSIFPQPDFDGPDDDSFVVDAAAFAARPTAHKTLVNLDRMFGADAVALWPNHACAQFVKNLKGGFVAGKTELPLKLQGRLSWSLGRNPIGSPEPSGKRGVGGLPDGAARESGINLAFSAA
jgi:hypothetical protein